MSLKTRVSQVDLFIDEAELRQIESCISERWLTEGPHAQQFQAAIKEHLGVKHAYFAPNGTLGLFLALLALDLEPGSEIIMPTFTFYGTAAAAVFAGLRPVFIDCDRMTLNSTAAQFEAAISDRTRALMPVHIYGQACDIDGIMRVAKRHDLKVVEDAAQALGVTMNGRSAGTFGDIGVFSLFSDKVITTGEGGILVTNDDRLAERIALIRNQGRPNSGTFIHPALGMNFRITDMQAAIGRAQLGKLPAILADRARKWKLYEDGLRGVGDLRFMHILSGSSLVPFRFPIVTAHREALMKEMEARGIQTRGFFYPMHLQPKLRQYATVSCPIAEELNEQGICLPIHYQLTDLQIAEVIAAIRDFFGA
jgi:perosamine synthetase